MNTLLIKYFLNKVKNVAKYAPINILVKIDEIFWWVLHKISKQRNIVVIESIFLNGTNLIETI